MHAAARHTQRIAKQLARRRRFYGDVCHGPYTAHRLCAAYPGSVRYRPWRAEIFKQCKEYGRVVDRPILAPRNWRERR